MKLGDIKGESQNQGHRDEIDILSWSWSNDSTSTSGSLCVMDVAVTKYTDSATVDILMGQMMDRVYQDAMITMTTNTGDRGEVDYFQMHMRNVSVSSYNTGGSGEQRMLENITLHFDEANIIYRPQDPNGKPGVPEETRISSSSHKCR
ncbi:Hcp family type VI secretion system effector [Shewanella sp.]|uniref:Hcp family type VI secretion system effector n=1 Tax=Shewanella sp. TaxID=50422 RepID=UPI003561B353